MKNHLLLSTRKGLLLYKLGKSGWKFHSEHFSGIPISIAEFDHRTGTLWAAADHGHWGQKLHFSENSGKEWHEAVAPFYPEGEEIKEGIPASLSYIWSICPGGVDQIKRIYFGTEPGGLFASDDGGKNSDLVRGLWNHPSRKTQWFGGGRDNAGIHSILINPKNSNHILVGISCAGVFETTDGGKNWIPKNKGLKASFLPDPKTDVGHDPHLLVACKSDFKMLWQQNHCGIFRSTNGGKSWRDVSQKGGPAFFGFTIAVDELNPECVWVVPAVSDEKRIAIDGALVVCNSQDGGKNWKTYRRGLPQKNCYDIVYRHSLDIIQDTLAFGTTTGNLYLSNNRGKQWETISNNLPLIYALRFT